MMPHATRVPSHEPGALEYAVSDPPATGSRRGRILVVDINPIVRERLTREMRSEGYEVVTAATGEDAFHILREWQHPIDWLYSRADLPGLIDGAILADQYHEDHPGRAAVLSGRRSGTSTQGDILLKDPSVGALLKALRFAIGAIPLVRTVTSAQSNIHPLAA